MTDDDQQFRMGPCKIKDHLRELGVLVGIDGPNGNVLKVRPPLPFAPEHAAIALDAMDKAMTL